MAGGQGALVYGGDEAKHDGMDGVVAAGGG